MSGGDLVVVLLTPLFILLAIAAYAEACSRYPRRDRNGARR